MIALYIALYIGFNPSQVGYKLFTYDKIAASLFGFNPSQVGYKRDEDRTVCGASEGFNPSQVGYKHMHVVCILSI